MSRSAYPTASHLIQYAQAMGLVAGSPSALYWVAGAAQSAPAEWERRTGYSPFLASSADSDRYFDPPVETRFLPLDCGLVSLTSLSVGSVLGGSAGTPLVSGTSFRAVPQNAPSQGRSYEAIEVLSQGYGTGGQWPYSGLFGGFGGTGIGPFGRAGSIKITGKWGRQTTLTDDVWRAILSLGLLTALPEVVTLRRKGLVKWEEGGVSEDYGPKPFADLESRLRDEVERILPLYTRPKLYF